MKSINFPDVRRLVMSLDKNNIWQYYEKEFCITDYQLLSDNPFILYTENWNCLFTNNEMDKDIGMNQYAILTHKKPTVDDYSNGKITFKRWLKHPKFNFLLPEEIIETWKNGFNFIREDEENNIKGLRPPQWEALYHILASLNNHDEYTTLIIEKPQIIKTEYGRDFGPGFYTTDIRSGRPLGNAESKNPGTKRQ
jgi:hypothetical protein